MFIRCCYVFTFSQSVFLPVGRLPSLACFVTIIASRRCPALEGEVTGAVVLLLFSFVNKKEFPSEGLHSPSLRDYFSSPSGSSG